MDDSLGPVAPAGITGVATGLGGGTICATNRVPYTVGERFRQRFPSMPYSRFVVTDTSFELKSLCMVWIVAYVGFLSIGGILRIWMLLTGLSTEVAAMVGGGRTN